MSRYKHLAYTEAVRQVQAERGSPAARATVDQPCAPDQLGPDETAFIAARDTFFLATVSESGWPCLQHRGGPPGFVHVIGPRTLAYADVRGNRQYISAGNLRADDRVAALFIDFATGGRLKLMGHAQVIDPADAPSLATTLASSGRRTPGNVEHLTVVTVEGFNWNCPKHITLRYTRSEINEAVPKLRQRVAELERENEALRGRLHSQGEPRP